ncbi:PQQ-dependent dehydrogenase, methanol/ethanol family [Pseudohongiella sp.]|uniref:Cytochrome c domain-containing protein n=1 Tax=marine sediment metagenome TaxID=412755 RepID=A0A0F9W0I8_9ZZZZ|nr:PQQ-dependent dehydrogenase, methanol/ethanol family [Pseudohongiella sp.]HDZ08416.1 PQQ-dependent dehydrogenase, methanol/ethanol family [Pseudohongiella sp.]HEA62781.1 PQQ-dependent dehydrogenase, methanol/ethanol family [Pseudohongiella sp.]
MNKTKHFSILAAAALVLAACGPAEQPDSTATSMPETSAPASMPEYSASVTTERLVAADEEPGQWMSTGRNYWEQRFSPLDQISTGNVDQLGLAWSADMDTSRGQEATPIVVDGAIYITTAWSMVKAFDAEDGSLLWEFDPEVDRARGVDACCDVVNRGVAAWDGKIFFGALDGRLIALDATTGEQLWSVVTTDQSQPYTITGAPRIVDGKVIIGNGGGEYGVRGYITAYDADTGEPHWRFYTVPGNPEDGFEQPELEMAAETWTGEWWVMGGGGTVWDSMAYDPESNLMYIGVGNGSPWNQSLRSPGGGDNLFLTSIVAINPDDGSYVWHYQTTPGETWDYTATQQIIVADLNIGGEDRRVVMQAPKNGFFYVLDALTGRLLSAENFVPVNWATHIDLETGRPVEIPEARYDVTKQPIIVQPGALGGHNWYPMSFSQNTNLVYLPATENFMGYHAQESFERSDRGWNTGTDLAEGARLVAAAGDAAPERKAYLLAWDPVAQQEVWRQPQPSPTAAAGVMSTAGGLVFQGNAGGEFVAYRDSDGERLWSAITQSHTVAAPVSYSIDGQQYVAVLTGSRALPQVGPGMIGSTTRESSNNSRLLVYTLGGTHELPTEVAVAEDRELNPPPLLANNEMLAHGEQVYGQYCSVCHGNNAASDGAGVFPDLRYTDRLHDIEDWNAVVLEGELASGGMVSFSGQLEEADSEAVLQYVISRANALLDSQ